MILTIAHREWRSAFFGPLTWGLLTANQLILAWVFLGILEKFSALAVSQKAADLNLELSFNLFGFSAILLLLSTPPLAMGMLSGERREGSLTLLTAAPISLGEILLGKWLGLMAILTPLTLLPLVTVLFLLPFANLDLGLFGAATLGLWCCGSLFAAVSLFASSAGTQPGFSAISAYGILILLSVIGNTGTPETGSLFNWLAWNEHLFPFLLGTIRPADLLYFSLFIGFFLSLAHRRLANERLP